MTKPPLRAVKDEDDDSTLTPESLAEIEKNLSDE